MILPKPVKSLYEHAGAPSFFQFGGNLIQP
jgi:hypothetical protein